jgi:hypothetical protein
MANAVSMPRSGVWFLRSKRDPRWDRTGQYSSLVGEPPLLVPAEVQKALEEICAALGEKPPEDLTQIALPYPSPKFKRLFDFHVFAVSEQQALFQAAASDPASGLSEVVLDWRAGELCLGAPGQPASHRLPAQFLGILDEAQAYWQWGWCSEGFGTLNPQSLDSARALREYGRQHEIPEMTYGEIPLGRGDDRPWFHVDYFAMVSAHLRKADFYVAMPVPEAPELVMYWLITAPGFLPNPRKSESERLFFAIGQAMPHWGAALLGSDGREVIRAFADQKGCRASEDGDRLRIDTPSGESLLVDFDASGAIAGMELPRRPRPDPEPVSWLGRLFGGKGRK